MEWRDIPGWEAEYQISDEGLVRRKILTYRNRYRAAVLAKQLPSGYWQVWLGGRSGRNHYIHRLVAFAFIGPAPSDHHEIAHWDGDKGNNRVANLRWATRVENTEDKRRQDAHPKLTLERVQKIRARLANHSRSAIAREFGVSPVMISKIALGKAWAGA